MNMNINNTFTHGSQSYTLSAEVGEGQSADAIRTKIIQATEAILAEIGTTGTTPALLEKRVTDLSLELGAKFQLTAGDIEKFDAGLQTLTDNMPVDLYAVMAMIQRNAQEMRNTNREIRASELDAQVSDLLGAADKMETAAKFKLAAGLFEGATQITAGAIQLGGALKAAADLKASKSAPDVEAMPLAESLDNAPTPSKPNAADAKTMPLAEFLDDAPTPSKPNAADAKTMSLAEFLDDAPTPSKPNAADAKTMPLAEFLDEGAAPPQSKDASEEALKMFDNTMSKAKANADILSGVMGMGSAYFRYEADTAEAQSKRLDATARLHESASTEANEMMQQMMDVIRDVREKVSSIQQAAIETNRGIARNV